MNIMTFTIRGESILIGFLSEFYTQDVLYDSFLNPFKYTNNRDKNSLYIGMSESDEIKFPLPALILQEGGFQENIQATGANTNVQNVSGSFRSHETPFFHPYTIHCIGRTKGEAKFLQASTAKAIIAFRRALGELGIDSISPIQGMPPQRMTEPDMTGPSQPYDCPLSFQITMAQQFDVTRVEDPNSQGYDTGSIEEGGFGIVYPVPNEHTTITVLPGVSGSNGCQ